VFLSLSLALHALMGMLLPQALLSGPSPIPPIIAVRIIEEKRIPEEKMVPPTVRRVRQEIPPPPKIAERKDLLSPESLPSAESSSAEIIPKESNWLEVQTTKETFKGKENAEKREDLPTPEKPSEEEAFSGDVPGKEPERLDIEAGTEFSATIKKAEDLDLGEMKEEGNLGGGKKEDSTIQGMAKEGHPLAGDRTPAGKLSALPGGVWLESSIDSGRIESSGIKGKGGGEGRGKVEMEFGGKGVASLTGSSEGKGRSDFSSYLHSARMRIEQAKKYPREAIRKKWEGKVVISFQIDQRGEAGEIKIVQSSGHRVLDEEGKATIRRASPFPAPPSLEKEKLQLQIPILFRLDREN